MSSVTMPMHSDKGLLCNCEGEKSWNVIYLRAHHEKQAHDSLTKWGVESFLPLRRELHQWRDRKKWIDVPLFSSYVFVNITSNQRGVIYQLNGFVRFLTSNGKPSIVPRWQIDAIGKVTEYYPDKVESLSSSCIGLKGKITGGPLTGVRGEIVDILNQRHFIIRIEGLDQVLKVTIPDSLFEPIGASESLDGSLSAYCESCKI